MGGGLRIENHQIDLSPGSTIGRPHLEESSRPVWLVQLKLLSVWGKQKQQQSNYIQIGKLSVSLVADLPVQR